MSLHPQPAPFLSPCHACGILVPMPISIPVTVPMTTPVSFPIPSPIHGHSHSSSHGRAYNHPLSQRPILSPRPRPSLFPPLSPSPSPIPFPAQAYDHPRPRDSTSLMLWVRTVAPWKWGRLSFSLRTWTMIRYSTCRGAQGGGDSWWDSPVEHPEPTGVPTDTVAIPGRSRPRRTSGPPSAPGTPAPARDGVLGGGTQWGAVPGPRWVQDGDAGWMRVWQVETGWTQDGRKWRMGTGWRQVDPGCTWGGWRMDAGEMETGWADTRWTQDG